MYTPKFYGSVTWSWTVHVRLHRDPKTGLSSKLAGKGHSVKNHVWQGYATQACMARGRPFSRFCLLGMLLEVRIFCSTHG